MSKTRETPLVEMPYQGYSIKGINVTLSLAFLAVDMVRKKKEKNLILKKKVKLGGGSGEGKTSLIKGIVGSAEKIVIHAMEGEKFVVRASNQYEEEYYGVRFAKGRDPNEELSPEERILVNTNSYERDVKFCRQISETPELEFAEDYYAPLDRDIVIDEESGVLVPDRDITALYQTADFIHSLRNNEPWDIFVEECPLIIGMVVAHGSVIQKAVRFRSTAAKIAKSGDYELFPKFLEKEGYLVPEDLDIQSALEEILRHGDAETILETQRAYKKAINTHSNLPSFKRHVAKISKIANDQKKKRKELQRDRMNIREAPLLDGIAMIMKVAYVQWVIQDWLRLTDPRIGMVIINPPQIPGQTTFYYH